jgi:pyruvate dehydrogenase E1 component alpha subunit
MLWPVDEDVREDAGGNDRGQASPAEAVRLYETMLLTWRTEERLRDDAAVGKLPGAVHLYLGEEAVAARVCGT